MGNRNHNLTGEFVSNIIKTSPEYDDIYGGEIHMLTPIGKKALTEVFNEPNTRIFAHTADGEGLGVKNGKVVLVPHDEPQGKRNCTLIANSYNEFLGMHEKKAAFNPALFADDALDAYVMYNANKPKQQKQRQYKSPAVRSPITKFAGFMDVLTSAATFTRDNPVTVAKAVAPFVAATGAGIAASMYAPFWAGGPNEGEEKVNKKRMLRNTLAYNSAMLYAPTVAPAFKDLTKAVESKDVLKTVGGLGNMAPAVATAYGAAKLLKNRGVGDKNLVNYFNRGESIKFVANLPGFLQRVSNFVENSMVAGGGI